MLSMYELTKNYLELQELMINAETEEDVIAIKDTLSMIDEDIDLKAENTAKFIKVLEADNDGVTKEIERLQARKKRQKSLIEMLKENLDDAMHVKGIKRLNVNGFTISYRKSTVVNVLDLNAIPVEYKRVKVSVDADRVAIKAAKANNIIIPGTEVVDKQNIQIK